MRIYLIAQRPDLRRLGRALRVCKAPHLGRIVITVDGVQRTAVPLAQSFTSCGVLIWKGATAGSKVHTAKLTALGGPIDFDRAVTS